MAAKKTTKKRPRKRSNVIELRPAKKPRKKRPAKKRPSGPMFRELSEFEIARSIKRGELPDPKLSRAELEAIGWTVQRLDSKGRAVKEPKTKKPTKRTNTEIRANERKRFARRKKKAEAKRNEYGPQAQAERATAIIIELSKHRTKKT